MNRSWLPWKSESCRVVTVSLVTIAVAVACGADTSPPNKTRDAGSESGGDPNGDPSVGRSEDPRSTNAPGDDSSGVILPGQTSSAGATGDLPITSGDGITIGVGDGGQVEVWCGSKLCACSDGLDNDGDGVADGFDPECTGPYDDNEETFATGIPGDNRDPKWQDCFFDGNSGAGDDNCRYHTDCLTGKLPPEHANCQLKDACVEFCQPLTPPGCDCFGCCEVPHGEGTIGIQLGSACSLANVDDEAACPRCVPTNTCANECGECELCLGKTLADLPASCFGTPDSPDASTPPGSGLDGGTPPSTDPPPGGPGNTCDVGEPCSANTECGLREYCRLGCCAPYPPTIR